MFPYIQKYTSADRLPQGILNTDKNCTVLNCTQKQFKQKINVLTDMYSFLLPIAKMTVTGLAMYQIQLI